MLAIRDDEVFMMMMLLAFAAFAVWAGLRHSLRRETLKTIQRVMESGHLDAATRDRLIEALAADQRRTNQVWNWFLANGARIVRTLFVGAGWLTLVISGVILPVMLFSGGSRYDIFGASVGLGIGFALVTLPLALRELEGRRVHARD